MLGIIESAKKGRQGALLQGHRHHWWLRRWARHRQHHSPKIRGRLWLFLWRKFCRPVFPSTNSRGPTDPGHRRGVKNRFSGRAECATNVGDHAAFKSGLCRALTKWRSFKCSPKRKLARPCSTKHAAKKCCDWGDATRRRGHFLENPRLSESGRCWHVGRADFRSRDRRVASWKSH